MTNMNIIGIKFHVIRPEAQMKKGFSKSIVLVIKYALSPSSKLGVKKNECTTTIRTLIVIIIL
jgi:hypothetical protein